MSERCSSPMSASYNLRKRSRSPGQLKRKASQPSCQPRLRRRTSQGFVDPLLTDQGHSMVEATGLKDAAALGFSRQEVLTAFKALKSDSCPVTLETLLEQLASQEAGASPNASSSDEDDLCAPSHVPCSSSQKKKNTKKVPGEDEDTCCICLEEFEGKAVFTTECGHRFHFNCIKSSVQKRNTECPLCRRSFETMTPPAALPAPGVRGLGAQVGMISVLLRARQTRTAQRLAIRALGERAAAGGQEDDSLRQLVHQRVQRAVSDIHRNQQAAAVVTGAANGNGAANAAGPQRRRLQFREPLEGPSIRSLMTRYTASRLRDRGLAEGEQEGAAAQSSNADNNTGGAPAPEEDTMPIAEPATGGNDDSVASVNASLNTSAPSNNNNNNNNTSNTSNNSNDSGALTPSHAVIRRTRSRSSRSGSRSSRSSRSSMWPANTEGRLEGWSFDETRRRVTGMIAEHPRYADGQIITTSTIRRARGRVVMTNSGSTYELGCPNVLLHGGAAIDEEHPMVFFGYPRT